MGLADIVHACVDCLRRNDAAGKPTSVQICNDTTVSRQGKPVFVVFGDALLSVIPLHGFGPYTLATMCRKGGKL